MRLALDPRARRLLRRVPHTTVYTALELVLLSALAVQCARLVWTLVTPVDPVGEWRTAESLRRVAPSSGALAFDPFFRLAGAAGPAVVTSLNLTLFGIREDRASGRGSAIVATPDGVQRSYMVGEEIMPGVRLTGVEFDSITIDRGGTSEQLYLDQSQPVTVAGTTPGAPPLVNDYSPPGEGVITIPPPRYSSPTPTPTPAATPVAPPVQAQPRLEDGQVTGFTVSPSGNGEAFRAAGLRPGDVVVSVNGQRITSADQARLLANQTRGSNVALQVERDGATVPVSLTVPQ